ncbi:MAG: DNA mismatch repair endonuclease MutL [Oscillospiraceae bacterium]|nr:DNA mismatch repair endonuclease MutL [Oscillospiraceae bacterium]
MPVISVLDPSVSELIAAGEVIERPASVIKELIENSIDAGARHITVEIKNGGTTFMRIVDDGCGMAKEDVPTAFLRHATSKIAEKADLDTILTLGFRGEALASVAAVSRVTVMTKRREDEYGTRYEIAGADSSDAEDCGCPDGTSIVIKDLFFNVPARRKFMKRDTAEANAVSQIIQKIAISHPEIAFKFLKDNKLEFHSDGSGQMLAAIHAVYGRDFARDLIPVDHEQDGIHVHGYTVKPLYSKSNRAFQNFFVNSRYVRSKACSVALESAYENMVMTGKFPACVLMLDMAPDTLDVNIHPAKAEVRFSDEKKVTNAIYFALKNAMLGAGLIYEFQMPKKDWFAGAPQPVYEQKPLVPDPAPADSHAEAAVTPAVPAPEQITASALTEQVSETPAATEKPMLDASAMPFGLPEDVQRVPAAKPAPAPAEEAAAPASFAQSTPPVTAIRSGDFIDVDAQDDTEEFPPEEIPHTPAFPEPKRPAYTPPPVQAVPPVQAGYHPSATPGVQELKTEEFPDVKVIGELFENYILAQSGETFIIIDKHAAHERVIFERLRRDNCKQYQQMLLAPCRVLLTLDEFSAMEDNAQLLERLGFTVDFSQKPYVTTTAAPIFFDGLDMDEIVQEIAHNLFLGKINPQAHILDDMLHEMACKSAIRAGDKNTIEELQALTERVCGDESIRHCPHGRPVMFTMSKYNLERQFRRRV